MTRNFLLAFLSLLLITAACDDDEVVVSADSISTPQYLTFRAQPVACGAEAPDTATEVSFSAPEDLALTGIVTAVVSTSCGEITIDFDVTSAPATVNSFIFLAEEGYFDGTVSHRVIPEFMIQMGDPTASGFGGPGYVLPDELPDSGFLYSRGTVAMANAGPNSGGSQFFLVLADAPLPPSFSVFGTVTEGLEVMDAIAAVPTIARTAGLESSSPVETIYIESIAIQR